MPQGAVACPITPRARCPVLHAPRAVAPKGGEKAKKAAEKAKQAATKKVVEDKTFGARGGRWRRASGGDGSGDHARASSSSSSPWSVAGWCQRERAAAAAAAAAATGVPTAAPPPRPPAGLKNKSKSAKVQKYVEQLQKAAAPRKPPGEEAARKVRRRGAREPRALVVDGRASLHAGRALVCAHHTTTPRLSPVPPAAPTHAHDKHA